MSTEYNPKTAEPRLKISARKSGPSDSELGTSAHKSGTSALGSKTLGPRSSALWVELNERGKTTFTLQDAEEITGLRGSSARTLIHKAERRGLVTRLRSGIYTLVPFELTATYDRLDPTLPKSGSFQARRRLQLNIGAS